MARWSKYTFNLLMAAFVLVPSSILLPLKLLCIALSAVSWVLWAILADARFSGRDVLTVLAFPLWLLVSAVFTFYSQLFSADIILRALISYVSIFILFVVCLVHLRYDLVSYGDVKRVFCICLVLYCAIKLFVMFIPLALGMSVKEASLLFSAGFLIEYRSEEQQFLRVATSNDLMLPFGLIILIFNRVFQSRILQAGVILLFLITSILTFTRFIWIACIMPFLFFFAMTTMGRKFQIASVGILLFPVFLHLSSLLGIGDIEVGVLSEIFVRAFDSTSLGVKEIQAARLYEMFSEAPIFGYGVGSYDKGYIRSGDLPFIYETQWISFLVQGGVVGVAVTLFYLLYPVMKILLKSNGVISKECLAFLGVYVLFLLSGFTNPNISALSAAMIYFLAYLYSHELQLNREKLLS